MTIYLQSNIHVYLKEKFKKFQNSIKICRLHAMIPNAFSNVIKINISQKLSKLFHLKVSEKFKII